MRPIEFDPDASCLVLTGAGASAESGIPTFRDRNGLWESHRVEEVATPEAFRRDPALVWRFYSQRRAALLRCRPNRTHHALAALERKLEDRLLLVTQNVDGLHQQAGSRRVLEMHGNLMTTRCSVCSRPPFHDDGIYLARDMPLCSDCGARGRTSRLRPHIVWFGETLDPEHLASVEAFMQNARRLLFLAVGTSGAVYPANAFVNRARELGGETWLVNREAAENATYFDHVLQGASGILLPELLRVAGEMPRED